MSVLCTQYQARAAFLSPHRCILRDRSGGTSSPSPSSQLLLPATPPPPCAAVGVGLVPGLALLGCPDLVRRVVVQQLPSWHPAAPLFLRLDLHPDGRRRRLLLCLVSYTWYGVHAATASVPVDDKTKHQLDGATEHACKQNRAFLSLRGTSNSKLHILHV